MINYFCPDQEIKSGGISQIYRHVEILNKHNLPAFILHSQSGFRRDDLADVPIKYLQEPNCLNPGDFLVIPEGFPGVMMKTENLPVHRYVFALSWSYILEGLQDKNWEGLGIEKAISVSSFVSQVVEKTMGVPVHTIPFSIDSQVYYPSQKKKQVTYFARKSDSIESLKKVLKFRNPRFINDIKWIGFNDLEEAEYAKEMRESSIYLALGTAEGANQSVFEAMNCRTLVSGYHGIGLQNIMIGEGEKRNSIIAENGDYISLAIKLEPILDDMLNDNFDKWNNVLDNGIEVAAPFTPEAEELSLLGFWSESLKQVNI